MNRKRHRWFRQKSSLRTQGLLRGSLQYLMYSLATDMRGWQAERGQRESVQEGIVAVKRFHC